MLRYVYMLVLCTLPLVSAHALDVPGAHENAPVRIEADSLEVSQEEGTAVFSGNVRATQGDLRMTGASMRVFYRTANAPEKDGAPAITKIEITGNVTITNGKETANGSRGVYDAENNLVTLQGKNITLQSGPHKLTGTVLVYDITTGRSRLEGGASRRVTGVFVPGGE